MCPSEDELRRYLNEELGEADRGKIDEHLEDCSRCSEALKAIGDEDAAAIAIALRIGALSPTPAPAVGTCIGRYKLLEEIGAGGMGTVWVAEQPPPSRRKVAIKLIKPGMDSHEVLARFQAEQQALALMDHPNIAKVLEGGLTDGGRPYFVMEYVKGVPITKYCDAMRLSVRAAAGIVCAGMSGGAARTSKGRRPS